MQKQVYINDVKQMFVALGGLCILYFFMFCNFWWGNHDWEYLKEGVSLRSGLFEMRYSQHLWASLLFDGHVLPVLCYLLGICGIGCIGFGVGKYLEVDKKYWFLLVLFIGANPHIFGLFYFVYLFFSFIAWSLVGVLLLFATEGKMKWYKFFLSVLGFVSVFGSYPPNLAFLFVLFVAKRLLMLEKGSENFKDICIRGAYFLGEIVCALLIYKIIYKQLLEFYLVNVEMYNIQLKGIWDIVKTFPHELVNAFGQMWQRYSFLGWDYVLPLNLIVGLAFFSVVRKSTCKWVSVLLVVGMFFVSRATFIVAERTDVSPFRLVYWARLGIYLFSLAVLLREKEIWVRNLFFLLLFFVLSKFVVINYEIQKVQKFGFDGARMYYDRVHNLLVENKNFDDKKKYISYNFGQPNFREKLYKDEFSTNELSGYRLALEFDLANVLFWEDEKSPIIIGAGINNKGILKVNRGGGEKWKNHEYWKNNPKNIENIRHWLYTKARSYPDENFVYTDDKYLILILKNYDFYNDRETVVDFLDK